MVTTTLKINHRSNMSKLNLMMIKISNLNNRNINERTLGRS